MKNFSTSTFRRAVPAAILLPVLLSCSLCLSPPALAQEEKADPEVRQPVPVNDLPPLNLPELPTNRDDPEPATERPNIPEPPPPRPEPTGPAQVKADIKPTGTRYFKLFYNGQPAGWSSFRVTGQMKLGETDAVILSSEGELRLGFDRIVPSLFKSRLMVDRTTLRPSYFNCLQKTGESVFEVECIYSETMVAQTNTTGDNRAVHFYNFEGLAPQLVFNNLWGHVDTFPEHYWLMVRSAVKGGRVKAYDPILRGEGEVIVYPPVDEDYEYLGRQLKTKVYGITDLKGVMLANVRVVADSFELLEVIEIGSGLKMVKAQPGVEKRMADIKGVDLTGTRIIESNVVFPDPEQLTALEADVDIDLRGGQLADHRIAGYRQYFTGELIEGFMKGRVFVRSVPREVPFDTLYPLDDEIPADLQDKLTAGPGIEMDFPPLATKAREIAWKSRTTFEAAKRLNGYVFDLDEGVSLPSARFALESGVGNSESKALLLVAMNRAIKLPARKISGIAFRDGDWVPHHWVEVWLGKSIGWTPFDPSTGEAGRVGAAHIALLDSGDVQNIRVRVTNYEPRATKKVPFIARELQWGVGEKRTYAVYRDGERVGTEVAAVGDIEVIEGQELYRFTARSEIQSEAGRSITKAEQLLTPQALPREIILEHVTPLSTDTKTYSFTEDTVVIRPGKEGQEEYEASPGREYPFAKGTYFTDPSLLVHWALMAGQVPLDATSEKEFPLQTFVPGAKSKKEMLLEVGEKEEISLTPSLTKDRRAKKAEEPKEVDNSKPEGETDSDKPEVEGETPEVEDPAKPADGQTEGAKPEGAEKDDQPEDPVRSITGDPMQALPATSTSNTQQATHLITDSGIDLWINDRFQIVKIEIPEQGLELILEKVETVLE
jgi:transglutaminase-like putative cysteine protease